MKEGEKETQGSEENRRHKDRLAEVAARRMFSRLAWRLRTLPEAIGGTPGEDGQVSARLRASL